MSKEMTRMTRMPTIGAVFASMMIAAGLMAASSSASVVWNVETEWGSSTLRPGGQAIFAITTQNVGTATSNGDLAVRNEFPPGVTVAAFLPDTGDSPWDCLGVGTSDAMCTRNPPLPVAARDYPDPSLTAPDDGFGMPGVESFEQIRILVDVAPSASGTHLNTTIVTGGGAPAPAVDTVPITIADEVTKFGLVSGRFTGEVFGGQYPSGAPTRQAGTHPFELRTFFDVTKRYTPAVGWAGQNGYFMASEPLRSVDVTLPRGMIGNPEAVPKCDPLDFQEITDGNTIPRGLTKCSPDSQVGYISARIRDTIGSGLNPGSTARIPLYNLDPPKGVPADFGYNAGGFVQGHIYPRLDPSRHYAIAALSPYISTFAPVTGAKVTVWGVPGDPAHDRLRAHRSGETYGDFVQASKIRPLLTMPTDCGESNGGQLIRVESWQSRQFTPAEEYPDSLDVSGCNDPRFRFEPEVELQPTNRAAGSPTGLDVHLESPQRNQTVPVEDVGDLYAENGSQHGIDTPPIKKVVVTFPEGMTISTSAAQGLGSCSAAELGLGTDSPVTCPDSSQYGTLTLHTPILPPDEPMKGHIYIAKQGDNPFNDFLSMYFVIEDRDRGLRIKIPGQVDLDPVTGQIRTTFDELPQFPVTDMQLTFKGGVRAALVNPTTCGTKTIKADFYSWAHPDVPVTSTSGYDVTQRGDGSACIGRLGDRPFRPALEAGTVSPSAGTYSPFAFRLQRTDDDQEFSQLNVKLPPGLVAKIGGISECSEAGIAQASARQRTGADEINHPSCPASSQIGTTDVGSGVGQIITYISGKAYLAGPYRGAPLSLVVISPIVVGPYDLGVIAVRSAIEIDPQTAQATVRTDPFPQIYQGIPVRIRDIRVKVDRPETMLNPTSCDPMAVTAHVTGTGGDVNSSADDTAADASSRFQAANCASLGFKPDLRFRLKGGIKRGDFPALSATLKGRPGDANIARTTVTLPRSEFIEQGHIRTICTRVQFAADECPAGSIYGHATAKSPLFDETLSGPVYLRSNGGERLLPDLVVSLSGKIEVSLAGFIDSQKGRVRNTFDVVPDAPVTEFKLSMQGGRKGLLVNHLNLCDVTARADVKMVGQNGKTSHTRPKMGTSCKKGAVKRHKRRNG